MARRLRIHVPDGWYHVMSRANGGEALNRTGDDRRRFLGLVSDLPGRFGTEIHAFGKMENHCHLLVRCRRTGLSETLRCLQTAYSVRFNWAHRRRGHVFQRRFQSVLIRDAVACWGSPGKIDGGRKFWAARIRGRRWSSGGWRCCGSIGGVRGRRTRAPRRTPTG